jgi:L-lactate dehydrogenase complex protein LldG
MSDRERILGRIRAVIGHGAPHPGPYREPQQPTGFEAFAKAVAAVGGEAHGPIAALALGEAVSARVREWAPAGRSLIEASAAKLLGAGLYEVPPRGGDPRSFRDVEVAVVAGHLGVAEDGAVAVLGRDAPNRALLFLAERLILLVAVSQIVPDLHAAFRSLPPDALQAHALTWISGPSKTADIEQTLVLGAHGPRALAVFGYAD